MSWIHELITMISGKKKKERSMLVTPVLREKKVTTIKHRYPKTSSIILISAAISIATVFLTFAAAIPNADGWFEQYSECRDEIIGFQQMGLYKSPEDFRLALSYCELR